MHENDAAWVMKKIRYLELVWHKALAELRVEASRAYIGLLWWVLEPVLYMLAFYIAFGSGIRGGGTRAMLFLLIGLVPWKWFASSVQNSTSSLSANSGLIQQVYFPKLILPFIVVLANTIKFFVVLCILLALCTLLGHGPSIYWIAILPIICVQFMLIAAFGSLCAAIVPIVPDLKLIVDNGLIVLMFVSGLFYDVSTLSPAKARLLSFNPLVPLMSSYRDVLTKGVWPEWGALAYAVVISLVAYACALFLFRKYDRHYAKLMIS